MRPLLAMTQAYDSNVLSSRRPVSDFVTRVSPGIETEYRSTRTRLLGRYTLDIERFARQTALTSADGRHAAVIDFRYSQSRRQSVALDAAFTRTHAPSELSTLAGLTLGRAIAERFEVHPSIVRSLNPITSATVEYTFTADELLGGSRSQVHRTAASLDRQISRRDLVGVEYEMRRWSFDPGTQPISHALRLGWSHPITRLLDMELHAGPVVTDGISAPDIAATVRQRIRPADVALSYARTQTAIIGLSGVADVQSLTAVGSIRLRPHVQLRVSPGASRMQLGPNRTDAWRLGFEAERRVGGDVLLRLSYGATAQRGKLVAIPGGAVTRHLVQLTVLHAPIIRNP